MFLKLNTIRNKYQEVLEEAEKNCRLYRYGGFDMDRSYAYGIFVAMCLHGKLEYLPENNIAWMKKLHPDMQDVFSRTIDGAKDLSEEERMEAIREIFDVLMGYIIYSDISVRYYGMAKGILFVMKELGTESYLDQKMVMANEHLIEKFICIVNPKERKKVEELLDTCGFREKVIS